MLPHVLLAGARCYVDGRASGSSGSASPAGLRRLGTLFRPADRAATQRWTRSLSRSNDRVRAHAARLRQLALARALPGVVDLGARSRCGAARPKLERRSARLQRPARRASRRPRGTRGSGDSPSASTESRNLFDACAEADARRRLAAELPRSGRRSDCCRQIVFWAPIAASLNSQGRARVVVEAAQERRREPLRRRRSFVEVLLHCRQACPRPRVAERLADLRRARQQGLLDALGSSRRRPAAGSRSVFARASSSRLASVLVEPRGQALDVGGPAGRGRRSSSAGARHFVTPSRATARRRAGSPPR